MLQDITKFLAAHNKVLEYDLQCMSQSHLTRLRSPEDIQIQKEFFQNIQVSVGKSNQGLLYGNKTRGGILKSLASLPNLCRFHYTTMY